MHRPPPLSRLPGRPEKPTVPPVRPLGYQFFQHGVFGQHAAETE